jgi:tryptophan-rich sensory protein
MRGLSRQIVLLLATLSTLVMNYLSNALPLFGRDNKEISDLLPNAFTPAGLTFAVWGVIFLGLIVFAVYQALPAQRGPRYDRLFWPFLLANLLNSVWLCAFQSLNFGLSVFVMLGLLGSLVWLYLTLNGMDLQGAERLTLGVPGSLYLAWISVATVANITAWLVSTGVKEGLLGLSPQLWSALLLVVASLIGAAMLRRRDVAFGLVMAWAFYGVYLARPQEGTVVTGVLVAAALLLVGAVAGFSGRRRHPLLSH